MPVQQHIFEIRADASSRLVLIKPNAIYDFTNKAWEPAPGSGAYSADNLLAPVQTEAPIPVYHFVIPIKAAVQADGRFAALIYRSTSPQVGNTPDEIIDGEKLQPLHGSVS